MGCQWLVERKFVSDDPDWYPDFPSDLYRIEPCGEPSVDPEAHDMCPFHLEAVTMDLKEFEDRVDNGETWS